MTFQAPKIGKKTVFPFRKETKKKELVVRHAIAFMEAIAKRKKGHRLVCPNRRHTHDLFFFPFADHLLIEGARLV